MLRAGTPYWITISASLLLLAARPAAGDENASAWPPMPAAPAAGPTNVPPSPQPSPYSAGWPPPGQDARTYNAGRQDWTAAPERPTVVTVAPDAPPVDPPISSTWYFRQESFYWNERLDGQDFVNEYGPLSTLGYVRRNRHERFRFELFGGTVAYDGGAQYVDGSYEPYHQSNGTNYLGLRGEYEFLVEPACCPRVRAFAGIGTRFWIRELRDAVAPSGNFVGGYQETWWTFFPYMGLETRDSEEPGWKFFGSMRFGLTPLTFEYVAFPAPDPEFAVNTALYPRCGLTGQLEFGIRFQKCSVSAYIETMTWGESAVARGSLQPESRMLTVGGKLGYTF